MVRAVGQKRNVIRAAWTGKDILGAGKVEKGRCMTVSCNETGRSNTVAGNANGVGLCGAIDRAKTVVDAFKEHFNCISTGLHGLFAESQISCLHIGDMTGSVQCLIQMRRFSDSHLKATGALSLQLSRSSRQKRMS